MGAQEFTSEQLFNVSWHLNQTYVIWSMLEAGILEPDDFQNLRHPVTGQDRPIYEWHVFTQLGKRDFEKLASAGIPILVCQLGAWVGFTDQDPGYDAVIHPKLLKILYGVEPEGADIVSARLLRPVMGKVRNRVEDLVGTG